MNKFLMRVLTLCLLCVVLTACQSESPYEVVLRPTQTPDVITTHTTAPMTTTQISDTDLPVQTPAAATDEIQTNTPEPTAAPEETTPAPTATPDPKPEKDMHFYVQRESKEVQTLFWQVYDAVLQHKQSIDLPKNTPRERIERVAWLLHVDCPELFWFSHLSEYSFMEKEPNVILSAKIDYHMDGEKAAKAQKEIDALLEKWRTELTNAAEYEKELFVHDALINRCRYADSSKHDGTAYGALILGKARCQGYANALCLGLRCMGVECAVVTGTATNASGTESHAWNLMKIDGTWTLTDATWNDPIGRDTKLYAYFNVTDAMMSKNHTQDDAFDRYDLPQCTSLKQNFCTKNGRYVKSAEDVKKAVTEWAVAYLENKTAPNMLCFEDEAQYTEALSLLSECFQAAADQTGKVPEGGSFHYLKEEGANYLQFDE